MCGITGFVDKKGKLSEGEKQTLLSQMIEKIAHRGRDARGVYINGSVALAHTRLSIVDLSPLGHQPMKNSKGNIILSYNGELYNHLTIRENLLGKYFFRSHSDTETLLCGYEEWGEDVLSKLKGMYAFSIFDQQKQKLFLAVDRFSIKPLYYIDSPDWFAWSSELKSLLLIPGFKAILNSAVLPEQLMFRSIAEKETLIEGVYKMLPGESLAFRLSSQQVTSRRYWNLVDEQYSFEGDNHAETIKNLLEESVKEHMLSDVSIGIQLSGGVDSSLIGALVNKNIPKGQELHSFSIGYGQEEWNEFSYSRQVASLLGTTHHELVFTEEEYCATLPIATYHYDEPINHSHSVPMFMLAKEASSYVKVLMSGEGSDEIFGGYRRYAKLSDNLTAGQVLLSNSFASLSDVQPLLGKETDMLFPYRDSLIESSGDRSPLYQLGWYDLNTYLTPLLLRQDKMGMGSTIENRVPFLDHDLVTAAFALTDQEKLDGNEGKVILKKVATTYLPNEIVFRTKVGFSQPIADWLRNDALFGKYLNMTIVSNKKRRIYDQGVLEKLADEHRSGKKDNSAVLWSLVNLELWMKIFLDGEDPKEIWPSLVK